MSKQETPSYRKAQAIIDDLLKICGVLEKKHGCKIELGGTWKYGESGINVPLAVTYNATDGSERTKGEIDFKRECGRYGLEPEHFGREVTIMRRTFKICGVRKGARKNQILGTEVGTQNVFTLPPSSVRAALGISDRFFYRGN